MLQPFIYMTITKQLSKKSITLQSHDKTDDLKLLQYHEFFDGDFPIYDAQDLPAFLDTFHLYQFIRGLTFLTYTDYTSLI